MNQSLARAVLRKWTVTVVVASSLLLPGAQPAGAQLLPGATQDPLLGSRVFGARGCVKCHAVNGVGGTAGPDLGRISHPRSVYEFAAAMWNHIPRWQERMRELGINRPHLDPRETGDLAAFLFTLNYFDPPGAVETGRRLFIEKKCVVCHQVAGIGGVVGPPLDFFRQQGSPIFVAAAMWNHGPGMGEAMRARGIKRPTFKESELRDLVTYVSSASPAPAAGPLHLLPGRIEDGQRLFDEKRCSACHGVAGKGGGGGPDLAEQGVARGMTQFAVAMWNKAPAMLAAMKARGITVPPLRADEMADLVAYLGAVRYFAGPGDARRGWKLVGDKGCLDCHSVRGQGEKRLPDLAQVRGLDSPAAVISALWNHSLVTVRSGQQTGGWPQLRPKEMADLMIFLGSLRLPGQGSFGDPPARPAGFGEAKGSDR